MAKTSNITVNAAGYTAVIANSTCKFIRINENRGASGFPNGDFLIAKPTNADTPVRIGSGASYTFQSGPSFFIVGQTVGYVKMVAGSTTFDQDEDQA